MEHLLAQLASRIRCLEIQAATLAGLTDAWSVVAPGLPRKSVVSLISGRLVLVASVAVEVREAVAGCIDAGVHLDILPLMETLAGVHRRIPVDIPGADGRHAAAALIDTRFAILSGCRPEMEVAQL